MEKRIELLTTFMMMNGWATDEISIQQLFLRHALPHSLRCISDVLDAYGIRHQITHRKGRLPANYLTLGLVLLISWGLSGLTVKKEFIQKEASKGLCHISGKDTCLELIRSKEAKLFGVMPLGILSFTYYSFLLFAFLMRPDNAMCVVIGYAALLTLPMIEYSVFWQTKHRKICPICIGIDLSLFFQLLLTLRFIRTSALLSEFLVVALPLSLFFFASLQAFILLLL